MRKLLSLLLIVVSINSYAQFNRLTIDFAPSFIEKSQLTITGSGNGYSISFKGVGFKEDGSVPDSFAVKLERFMSKYKFQHLSSITVIEEKKVVNGDTVIIESIKAGVDGIDVFGELINNDHTRKTFAFWSPREHTENHQLIEVLFGIAHACFTNKSTINYLGKLEKYF